MNKFIEQTKKAANKARQASISNLNAASTALSNASGANIKLTTAKTDEELKRLLGEEPVVFSGSVWKRRGGLGKLASYASAWESRHLQLRGSVLLYFDSDPTKALSSSTNEIQLELLRGYIDLAEERATVQATTGHSGAPSPFCLSIKVPVGLAQETKWKLCFDHHQTQMEWLMAISDVVVQYSVDLYNRALLEAANPSNHGGSNLQDLRRPPVYEPGTRELLNGASGNVNVGSPTKLRSNSFQLVDSPHQLWMMVDYTLERKTTLSKEQQAKTKASVDTALQVMERLLAEERNQRSVASQKVKALEIEVEDARKCKEQSEQELAKVSSEKKSLETELAIRISTHDLGDGQHSQAVQDNVELRTKVERLTQELETKTKEFEESKAEEEEEKMALEQKLAELETKLVIAESEREEAVNKAKLDVGETQREEAEATKSTLTARIAELEKEIEDNKKEYQEAIQALATSFQQSIGGVSASSPAKENGTTDAEANGESLTDVATPVIHRTRSDGSSLGAEEFQDCIELDSR